MWYYKIPTGPFEMPELDIDGWNVAAQNKRGEPLIIDGEALDITSDGDDTYVREGDYPVDSARDREGLLSDTFAIPYGPMRLLRPEELTTKAVLMRQLAGTIPRNEYDLPEYVYRVDLLDHQWIQTEMLGLKKLGKDRTGNPDQVQQHLDAAVIRLDYAEGFPTGPDGMPFWNKLSWEGQQDYDMFQAYLLMGAGRKISELIAYDHEEVFAANHSYFWDVRVRAFELYRIAHAARIKIERAILMDDDHFQMADKLLKRVDKVLDSFSAEEIKEVGFDKLIKVLGDLTKVQRISVGQPANGPAAEDAGMKAPTTSVIIQQIAQNQPQKAEESDENLDLLQESPEMLELAQDFILRSQKAKPIND